MASKLILAVLFVAVLQLALSATIPAVPEVPSSPSGPSVDLPERPWVSFKICMKSIDRCENFVATTADDLDEAKLTNGMKPIVLNLDGDEHKDEKLPLSLEDIASLTEEEIATIPDKEFQALIEDLPLEEMSTEELEALYKATHQ